MRFSRLLIPIFIWITLLNSCVKESLRSKNPGLVVASDEEVEKMTAFMLGVRDIPFKYDYLTLPIKGIKEYKLSKELWDADQLLRSKKKEVYAKHYPEIKNNIIEAGKEELNPRVNEYLQKIALRYLRNFFLEEDNSRSVEESKFLMDILITYNNIDLDILADTFLKIESNLTSYEREVYIKHFRAVYRMEQEFLEGNSSKLYDDFTLHRGEDSYKEIRQDKLRMGIAESLNYAERILGSIL